MSKKEKKYREPKFDDISDARTAEFVMRRLESIESDLVDLLPDVQSLRHYDDLSTLSWCLQTLKRLRKRYRKLAEGFSWKDQED